jgi:hypothetical protein
MRVLRDLNAKHDGLSTFELSVTHQISAPNGPESCDGPAPKPVLSGIVQNGGLPIG